MCKTLFQEEITPKQEEIITSIAWDSNKRIVISCLTRYGKSFCVSMAILLYIAFHTNKRILLISPTMDQTKILRDYIAMFITRSEVMSGMLSMNIKGIDKIKYETSRKQIVFTNGCSLKILSAEGSATRLMGHGGDLIVLDESCLIDYEVYRGKISRMLGDNPDSMLVEIGNPWHRNNQMWKHWLDPDFQHIKVGWETALKEGRITKTFVDEQRALLTPLEFEVLYEANFPEESEDSIFKYKYVMEATTKDIKHVEYNNIISCDVADKGKDRTVIMDGTEEDDSYFVRSIYSEATSDNMAIAGRIVKTYWDARERKVKGKFLINIDTIGVGVGVVSRVKEVLAIEIRTGNVTVNACHYGEGVGAAGQPRRAFKQETIEDKQPTSGKKRFMNKKAEQYFRLKSLFEEGRMRIPNDRLLIDELMSMSWELTSSGKIKIVDPEEKSPDFCFVAGTKVLTTKGYKNIELINIDDKVITPFGERKVLNCSSRIVKEVYDCKLSNGKHMIATGSHNIYTNETFKYLMDFKNSDKVESGILKWRIKNLFTNKEHIGFQESIITQTSIMEQDKKEEKRKHYIDKYGKMYIMKQFLKDTMHIILMEIPLITLLKISKYLKFMNIGVNTKKTDSTIIKNYILNLLLKPKKKLKNGIEVKQVKNGINNIMMFHSEKQNITKKDVRNAMSSMKQEEKKNHSFVQENVICDTIEPGGMVKKGFVHYVKRFLQRINILKQNFVQKDVLLFPGGIRVYNIEVDVDHVYYADDVLVSNSDSLVYFIWKSQSFVHFNFGGKK